jgi:membrane peptidoglycan carboxypeptidase
VLPIQAAFLASIIANPVRYHYMKQRGYVGDGWRTVLSFVMQKMVERGTISQEDWDLAAANNFEVPFTYLAAMPRPEPVEPTPAPADASPEPPPEMPDFPD